MISGSYVNIVQRSFALCVCTVLALGCSAEGSDEKARTTSNTLDSDGDGVDDAVDQCDGRLYGKTIVVPTDVQSDLTLAASDLTASLGQVAGQTFTQTTGLTGPCVTEGGTAIHIRKSTNLGSSPQPPTEVQTLATQLASPTTTRDSYAVYSASGKGLWIIAPRASGLRHGIYEYLQSRGVSWLLPNPLWKIVPASSNDVRWSNPWQNGLRAPTVGSFWPIPTGKQKDTGPPTLPTSFQGFNDQTEWGNWKFRNRFPGEYLVSGPSVAFNQTKTPVLCASPPYPPYLYLAVYPASAGHQTMNCPNPLINNILTQKWHYTFTGACVFENCDTAVDPPCTNAGDPGCDYTSFGGLTKLFAEFEYAELKTKMQANADSAESQFIAVAQGDGGQHCDCEKCRNILKYSPYFPPGTYSTVSRVSDRLFHLANRTAEHVARQAELEGYGTRGVAVHAHSEAADPPTIPLNRHLLALTEPYIYNGGYVWLTPEELEEAWRVKRLNNVDGQFVLGAYDSWIPAPVSLPGSNATSEQQSGPYDLPTLPVSEAAARIDRWITKDFKYVQFETTYSGAAVGLHWLVAGAKAWNPSTQTETFLSDFFTKSFGTAAAPHVRRMFDRWWKHFDLNKHELGLCYQDIQAAANAVQPSACDPLGQPSTWAPCRLDDIRAYLHYLRLYYEYDLAFRKCGTNYAAFETATDQLIEYLWRIYPRNVVFSNHDYVHLYSRLSVGANPNCPGSSSPTLISKWNASTGTGFASLSPIPSTGTDSLASLMTQGASAYPPMTGVPALSFSSTLVPLLASAPACGGQEQPPCTSALTPRYNGDDVERFSFVMRTAGDPQLKLDAWNTRVPPNAELYLDAGIAKVRIKIRDATGAIVHSQDITVPKNTSPTPAHTGFVPIGPMTLPVGTYALEVWGFDPVAYFQLEIPFGLPFAQTSPQYIDSGLDVPPYGNTHVYFYVPFGTSKFVLAYDTATQVGGIKFFYPAGPSGTEIVSPAVVRHGAHLYEVQVPSGADGQVWSLNGVFAITRASTPWFVNIPTIFSFAPEQMLIPSDACAEQTAINMPVGYGQNLINTPNNSCIRIKDGMYPAGFQTGQWVNFTMSGAYAGQYPTPFVWRNQCGTVAGRGMLVSNQFVPHPLGPLNISCPTLIKLQGDGNGVNTVRIWPWACTPTSATLLSFDTPYSVSNTLLACLKIDNTTLVNNWANFLTAGAGNFPLDFEWANTCGDGNSGFGTLTSDTSAPHPLGPVDDACPTLIRLKGASGQTAIVKYQNWTP